MIKDRDLVKVFSTDTLIVRIRWFLSVLAETKSKATVDTYRRALGIFTLWIDEQGGTMELSQKNLEMFPVYLRTRRKVTVRTVYTYLTALRKFFAFLTKEGMLDNNLAKDLRIDEKPASKGREILTPDEVKRLVEISYEENPIQIRDKAILLCMLLEGLSESDIERANFGDIENTITGKELRIQTKSGPIAIPLDQRTFNAISDYIKVRSWQLKPKDPLFVSHSPHKSNERMTRRNVRSRMRFILDHVKITRVDVSPQSLCYTALYLLITNGTSKEDIRRRFRPFQLFHRIIALKEKGLIEEDY
ncbi:MAG: tyrosine-type recombinase/integrase [Bacteroidetes bacterium]|nr:tyrosine-type recombinase/integrase [Bacteroidota bacterium]